MLVRYFMNSNVLTLTPDQTCLNAFRLLKQNSIRRAPVVHERHLVGMISERDLHFLPRTLLQADEEAAEEGIDKPVRDIMATQVHIISPNAHIEKAARLMLKYKIGGLPVLKDGHIEGIITESDIFKAMWGILSFKTNYRILLFDKESEADSVTNDYIQLCFKHNCTVNTFLSYPKPDGGHMHYLCIQDGNVDELVKDLWDCSCDIVFVEREENSRHHNP